MMASTRLIVAEAHRAGVYQVLNGCGRNRGVVWMKLINVLAQSTWAALTFPSKLRPEAQIRAACLRVTSLVKPVPVVLAWFCRHFVSQQGRATGKTANARMEDWRGKRDWIKTLSAVAAPWTNRIGGDPWAAAISRQKFRIYANVCGGEIVMCGGCVKHLTTKPNYHTEPSTLQIRDRANT